MPLSDIRPERFAAANTTIGVGISASPLLSTEYFQTVCMNSGVANQKPETGMLKISVVIAAPLKRRRRNRARSSSGWG
ncbi:unannotated protein [freshwater metagenome]|uniref:Unannotated protein n=1 Tax=freshwater metagenome TaxID=449393 RepID=A0A6J7EZS3_9ZZZZ